MTEDAFLSQLRNLRRSIRSDKTQSGVLAGSLISYAAKQQTPKREESAAMILGELLCDEVLDDTQLCRQTLLPAINAYRNAVQWSDTDLWADIFERYLGSSTGCRHPLVYADILRVCRSEFRAAVSSRISLPLDEQSDLPELFDKWGSLFCRYLADGCRYLLMSDAHARNDIAKYLYSLTESASGTVRVTFPYPGTGLEPLLLGYTMSLISEVRQGKPLDNVRYTLRGDKDGLLRSIGVSDESFDEVFINLKNSFCEQNRLKVRDIKTNLKSIKRKITVSSECECEPNVLAYIDSDGTAIYESTDGRVPDCYETVCVIAESFDHNEECPVKYVLCRRQSSPQTVPAAAVRHKPPKDDYIDHLYDMRASLSGKQIKTSLSKTGYIVSEDQMLRYAELLLLAGQYAKSFNVIKQHYDRDFDKSYQMLQSILAKCKNSRLNGSVERFIMDKEMNPDGFGEAMLEAIADGIEDYFDANPDSVLKDKQWL